MTIQRIETGARMSKVVIHGDTVYLAGFTAKEALSGGVGLSLAQQMVLNSLTTRLTSCGFFSGCGFKAVIDMVPNELLLCPRDCPSTA
jgi:enamine deaminase RidA (YjgF/YER057c/UK114 family)